MTVRAVLFDFDHTLVDSPLDFGLMRRGVLAALAEHGATMPEDQAGKLLLEVIDEATAGLVDGAARRARGAALDWIEQVEREAAARTVPIPGVAEALTRLRADGRRVGIITRNARPVVLLVLSRHPLDHDALLCREDVTAVKPDPAHAMAALDRLGVSPAGALLVGDFRADMACARAAGIMGLGVLTGREDEAALRDAGADWVLPSAAELPEFLFARGW